MFLPGSESNYKHELKGYLAGLSYLGGSTEHSEVLRCLHQCAESLQIPAATDVLIPGMEMVVDAKGSRVVVVGNRPDNISALVRQVTLCCPCLVKLKLLSEVSLKVTQGSQFVTFRK